MTLLRRRGWTAESLKIGEMVTIDGWPSRRLPLPPGAARRPERRDRSRCPAESAGGLRARCDSSVLAAHASLPYRRRLPRRMLGLRRARTCPASGAPAGRCHRRRAGEGASAQHGGPGRRRCGRVSGRRVRRVAAEAGRRGGRQDMETRTRHDGRSCVPAAVDRVRDAGTVSDGDPSDT